MQAWLFKYGRIFSLLCWAPLFLHIVGIGHQNFYWASKLLLSVTFVWKVSLYKPPFSINLYVSFVLFGCLVLIYIIIYYACERIPRRYSVWWWFLVYALTYESLENRYPHILPTIQPIQRGMRWWREWQEVSTLDWDVK